MTLDSPQYLTALARESARFAAVLAEAPSGVPVPTCPDWDADDLLWHLAEVQWFWSRILRVRPEGPDAIGERPERPADRAGLLALFRDCSAGLQEQLAGVDPVEPAWSWAREQTAGFTFRRQAHEALIHRVDAELVSGVPVTDLDPALADDGVAEALDVMYGGLPPEGVDFLPSGGAVAVRLSDTGTTWWVRPGQLRGTRDDGRELSGPHLLLLDGPDVPDGLPAAAISGTASEVDRWLWKRLPDDAVERTGDPAVLADFEAAVRPAIE